MFTRAGVVHYVETVISLAPNLFFVTTIAVNILVLPKHKQDACHPIYRFQRVV